MQAYISFSILVAYSLVLAIVKLFQIHFEFITKKIHFEFIFMEQLNCLPLVTLHPLPLMMCLRVVYAYLFGVWKERLLVLATGEEKETLILLGIETLFPSKKVQP